MKKILHISKYYLPYAGGIEDVCHTIVNMMKNKAEQIVFCFNDNNTCQQEVYDGIAVWRVARQTTIASQPISLNYRDALNSVINEFNPDIIHFHAPNPLGCYHLLRAISPTTKLVVHWHSDIIEQNFLYRLIKPLETKLLKRANTIIVSSPNYLAHSLPLRLYRSKCVVIPNVIDVSKFTNNESIQQQVDRIKSDLRDTPIILFVGRHVKYKGLADLIAAEKYIKSDCQILVGGDGPLSAKLKQSALDSNRISFLGRVADSDICGYYRAATVFAFPSITKNEAFGVALIEAMYCGAVPVTFTIEGSGVNWVNLSAVSGIEVPNRDAKAFAEAIDWLLTNSKGRTEMSTNAVARVEKLFVPNSIQSKLDEIYEI